MRWALAGCVLFWTSYLTITGDGSHVYTGWAFNATVFVLTLTALVRHGLLGGVMAIFGSCVIFTPLTPDPSAWYADLGLIYAGMLAALGVFGFYHALGARSLLSDPILAEPRRA